MSSDGMRRRSRSVPRPDGAVPHRGPVPGHQLPVYGRLRGPRVLLGRDCHIACRAQGKKNNIRLILKFYSLVTTTLWIKLIVETYQWNNVHRTSERQIDAREPISQQQS